MTAGVLFVGHVLVDVVAAVGGPVNFASDTSARVTVRGGGAAANSASWLASCGGSASLLGTVSDDDFARIATGGLADAGVELLLRTEPGAGTGICVVIVTPGGERTFLVDPKASLLMRAEDLPDLSRFGFVHLSGYVLFDDPAHELGLATLADARRLGVEVVVDAASAAPLAEVGAQGFLDWVGPDIVLLANLDEAEVLTGTRDPAAAARALAARCREAVVKCGADGAYWAAGDNGVFVPAPPIAVTDSTGAGDAFAAGFLLARSRGAAPREQLESGHRIAAECLTRHGGR